MNVLIGIAGAALLFVIFGLSRRGREDGVCEGCEGGCAGHGGCHAAQTSHGRSTDART